MRLPQYALPVAHCLKSVAFYILSCVIYNVVYGRRANSVSYSTMARSRPQPHLRMEIDELISLLSYINSLLSDVWILLPPYKSLTTFSPFSPSYSFL